MSLPADHDDSPPPEPTTLLLALLQSAEVLAARLDSLEAAHTALRHDLQALGERLSDLSEQSQTVQAFGWDYVALVQRLAVIEEKLDPKPSDVAPPDPPAIQPAP